MVFVLFGGGRFLALAGSRLDLGQGAGRGQSRTGAIRMGWSVQLTGDREYFCALVARIAAWAGPERLKLGMA